MASKLTLYAAVMLFSGAVAAHTTAFAQSLPQTLYGGYNSTMQPDSSYPDDQSPPVNPNDPNLSGSTNPGFTNSSSMQSQQNNANQIMNMARSLVQTPNQ